MLPLSTSTPPKSSASSASSLPTLLSQCKTTNEFTHQVHTMRRHSPIPSHCGSQRFSPMGRRRQRPSAFAAVMVTWLSGCCCCLLNSVVLADDDTNDLVYTDCTVDDYYGLASLPANDRIEWTRDALQALVTDTHRTVLPYTDTSTNGGRDDVWSALTDLDPGTFVTATHPATTVHLIYVDADVPAEPHGTSTTWNREHLWPSSRGVDHSGPDYTDVHHLRPADWNLNAVRNNRYFGECSDTDSSDSEIGDCVRPAHAEAALDTSKNSEIFTPPASVRGDIARALFYMDLRYSGQNNGDDLVLTDCLDDRPNEMGYLSVLLQWHMDDPVSEEEMARNDRVCGRYQGNRNPFVDWEGLAEQMFGLPQAAPYQCEDNDVVTDGQPTPSPVTTTTAATDDTDDTATVLAPGDVAVVAMHSDNPDAVTLVALASIPVGTKLYITDNAWTGTTFRSNEGSVVLEVVTERIPAGTVFGYGEGLLYGSDWTVSDAGFSLSATGDNVFVYTTNVNDDNDSDASDSVSTLVHMWGLSWNGPWLNAGLGEEEYETDSSALPTTLRDASVALDHSDNYIYQGPTENLTKTSLQAALVDPANWFGSNSALTDSSAVILPSKFELRPSSAREHILMWLFLSNGLLTLLLLTDVCTV